MPSIPKMPHFDWEQLIRKGRRNLQGSSGRNAVITESMEYPIEEFGDDLSRLEQVHGVDEAAKVVPAGNVRKRLLDISKGNAAQNIGGGIGAVGGGLLGAGAGALATRLAKGPSKGKIGLLAGIPSAIGGYALGKGTVRDQQTLSMLNEELGPGVGIKRAYVEEGFGEILNELHQQKQKGTYTAGSLKDALRDLKEGRGHGLKPTERHMIRRHLYGDKTLHYADTGIKPKPPKLDSFKPSGVPKPKPKLKPHWIGKKPLVIAGGLAALAGLGLTAAKFWPDKDDHKG